MHRSTTWILVGVTLALAACEPPPLIEDTVVGVDPSVLISFPVIAEDTIIALSCAQNLDYICNVSDPLITAPYTPQLVMTLAVDIDNIELTDPYQDGVTKVPGQGHWHVYAGEDHVKTSFARSTEFAAPNQSGVVSISASLRDNEHEALGYEDTLEFRVSPAIEDCTLLPADFCT